MTLLGARMAADGLVLSTSLGARFSCILAILGAMAILATEVRAALERLSTDLSTTSICQPTRHILQNTLAAQARLLR